MEWLTYITLAAANLLFARAGLSERMTEYRLRKEKGRLEDRIEADLEVGRYMSSQALGITTVLSATFLSIHSVVQSGDPAFILGVAGAVYLAQIGFLGWLFARHAFPSPRRRRDDWAVPVCAALFNLVLLALDYAATNMLPPVT